MLVTFGFTTWQSISGYVIQAVLEPTNGFSNRVRVYILLSGDAANTGDAANIRPRLQLGQVGDLGFVNNNINYSFPNITYIGNIFDYNNRFFYDILEFSYTPDNNRNNCQENAKYKYKYKYKYT